MTKGPTPLLKGEKQKQFIRMVKEGKTNKELAELFDISLTSVKRYKNILLKGTKTYNAKGKTILLNAGTDKGKLKILNWCRENFDNVTENIFEIISEYIEDQDGEKIIVGNFERYSNSKKVISEYINKTNEKSVEIIAHETGFSKRSVRKYCKENDIAIEGERKPSMYKKNIVDRWK